MIVTSLCAAPAKVLGWRDADGNEMASVIVRVTYVLGPGTCELAPAQEAIAEADGFREGEASPFQPGELVPWKPRADVVLVGSAFAPRGAPVRALRTRLVAGDVDKSVDVVADRVVTLDGEVREGARFSRMPLTYERATHDNRKNPVGVNGDHYDAYGRARLPNLLPPDASPGGYASATGYGPIASAWPQRAARNGASALLGPVALTRDLDAACFNAAPPDQQGAALTPDARIILEHLDPDHPRLVTNLPGLAPRVFVAAPGGRMTELALVADTLWIDTDRRLCSLTFRGHVVANGAGARAFVLLEAKARRLSVADAEHLIRNAQKAEALGGDAPVDGTLHAADAPTRDVLPFVAGEAPEDVARPAGSAERSEPPDAWTTLASSRPEPGHGPAWIAGAATPPAIRVAVPAHVREAEPAVSAPTVEASPWAGGAPTTGALGGDARRTTEGQRRAASEPELEVVPAPTPAIEVKRPSSRPRRVGYELLWVEPGLAARVREADAWSEILVGLTARPRVAAGAAYADPAAARDVLAVLASGTPTTLACDEVFDAAVGDDGAFVPPLLLVEGELELAFDERELLRATVDAARPFAAADKKLKEAVAAAEELCGSSWTHTSTHLVEALLEPLRDGFARAASVLGTAPLDTHVELTLFEARHYRRRAVLGARRIRATLASPGAVPDLVPAYLPDAIAGELPMATSLEVRALVELRPRQDLVEACPYALSVLGLARVFDRVARR